MNKQKQRKNITGVVKKKGTAMPPSFVPTLSLGHKFRFECIGTAATKSPITRDLLLELYQVGQTTTSTARLIDAVRLRKIEIWAPTTSAFVTQTVSLEWQGRNSPSTIHSDSSMNLMPAHVITSPPKESSASWWSIDGSSDDLEVLANISCPIGSIIDVTVSLRLKDDEPVANAMTGLTSVVPGTVYYGYLDDNDYLFPAGGVTPRP